MTCDEALELISACLDGELSAGDRRRLEAHLAACPACAELMEELTGQSLLLRQLDCQVPDGLSRRILSQLPPQAPPAKKGRVIRWKRWGTLAACLTLALWTGLSLPGASDPGAGSPHSLTDDPAPISEDIAPNQFSQDGGQGGDESAQQNTGSGASSFFIAPEETPGNNAAAGRKITGQVQYLRAQWSGTDAAPSARLIDSTQALDDCLASSGAAEIEDTERLYSEDYFTQYSLIAVTLEEGSGSVTHTVESVLPTQDGWEVDILRHVPEAGTCDMAAWLILIELDTVADSSQSVTVSVRDS